MDSDHIDLNFDLLETGCHGGVEVVPVQKNQSHNLPLKTVRFINTMLYLICIYLKFTHYSVLLFFFFFLNEQ